MTKWQKRNSRVIIAGYAASTKANDKFSGKGHARHICKKCQSLPKDVQADMIRCNEVEHAAFKFPMNRQDWELLEKYAKKYKNKESGQLAQDMLDMKRGCPDVDDDDECIENYETEEITFSELLTSSLKKDSFHNWLMDRFL